MNESNALDGFLGRAVPVRQVVRPGAADWRAVLSLGFVVAACGLLAPVAPTPESIEHGGVVFSGTGLAATLADLLRTYGQAAAGLSGLCLAMVASLAQFDVEQRWQALDLAALIGLIGSTAVLLGASTLFLLIILVNIALLLAVFALVLTILFGLVSLQ